MRRPKLSSISALNLTLCNMSKGWFLEEINRPDELGQVDLHFAGFDNPAYTLLLLEKKADPNIVDNNGQIPLYFAIRRHRSIAVRHLLEHGANPVWRHQFDKSWTLLHHAVSENAFECLRILCCYPEALAQQLECIQAPTGTPLRLAVSRKAGECAQVLLEVGAKTESCDIFLPSQQWWRELTAHFAAFKQGTRTFLGVLRFRLGQCKDMRTLLGCYVWTQRWKNLK